MAVETPARIAVLGAGPIGLETALYARYLGYEVDIYERGRVAENVLRWGHVRMFSPFGRNRSSLGLAALKAQDASWNPPADDALMSGRQLAEQYVIPLAATDLLAECIHEQTEVVSVGRDGPLKSEPALDEERADVDFRILLESTRPEDHGRQRIATADVVIDTTGTYGNHNWMGHGGIPAIGELAAQAHIEYGVADVLDSERRYASRRTLLVGDGYSAATSLVALSRLAARAPDTWITWVTRAACDQLRPEPMRLIPDDPLAERSRLARAANRLAVDDANHVTLFSGTTVDSLTWHADLERFSVRLLGKHAGEFEFDRVIANVGYGPDNRIFNQLQVRECYRSGAPHGMGRVLAARDADEIDPSTLDAETLLNPEPDFYILGSKSFGRDSRFFISHGLEQIRQLFTIIGDRAELNLYDTMAGRY
jgi:thioredoxin reductase